MAPARGTQVQAARLGAAARHHLESQLRIDVDSMQAQRLPFPEILPDELRADLW